MRKVATILALICSLSARGQMTFHWRQVSGPMDAYIVNPDSSTTVVSGLNLPGKYGFEFSATNLFGTGKDTQYVTVFPPKEVLALDDNPRPRVSIRPPTPTKFEVKVLLRGNEILAEIKSPQPQKVTIWLCNVLGQPLTKVDIQVKTGTQVISLPAPRTAGLYVVRFITYFDNKTERIMII